MQPTQGSNPQQGGLSWSTPSNTKAQAPAPVVKNSQPVKVTPPSKGPEGKSSFGMYAGFTAAGIIAGMLLAWGVTAWRTDRSAPVSETTTTKADVNVPVDTTNVSLGSPLTVATQTAGLSVIASADVSAPTWVVIYDNNNGTPGNALGAGLFFPGQKSGTVELLRATHSGNSYLATLQVDNGDKKFSLKQDQLVTVDGAPLWVKFSVQ